MKTDIKRIIVLVEFEDGSVRQVLATPEQKELALSMLVNEEGKVQIVQEAECFKLI